MVRERFLKSYDGTELYTVHAGEGMPIVLVDGIGCDGYIWRHLEPTLSRKYHVLRYHHRGHGRSKVPEDLNELGMEALRQDLLAVLDAYDIPKALLLGHSMGVQVILDAAVHAPERVSGLVPMCGSYGRMLDTFHDNGLARTLFPRLRDLVFAHPRRAQWLWRAVWPSELVFQYAKAVEVRGSLVRRDDFKPYFDHLARMDPQVFFRMLDKVRHHTVEDRLQELRVPTLVVAGQYDSFTPAWLSRRMQRLIPAAELLVVPHGSHAAPIEMPELVELRLARFMAEHLCGATVASARPTRPRKTRRSANPKARRPVAAS